MTEYPLSIHRDGLLVGEPSLSLGGRGQICYWPLLNRHALWLAVFLVLITSLIN